MAETDLIKLYSRRILALSADMPHVGRLETPMGTARKRSPQCGSTVTVDLDMKDGCVTRFAQDVKACALGQAAASVVGASVLGRSRSEVEAGRDALWSMLKEGGPVPGAPWQDLEVLEAARDYTNRHASILLAFDATLAAMQDAEQADCA